MKITIFSILVMLTMCLQGVRSQNAKPENIFEKAMEYVRDFAGGVKDMWRAYSDMREANTIDADKYFHARGNYEAAQRGEGGRDAAEMISNAREWIQGLGGHNTDSAEDQKANEYGRNGGNPDDLRPKGLDSKY